MILWAVSEGGAMRSRYIYTATLFCALVAPARGVASDQVNICAQFSATGQSYHVTAISTNGSELNETTDSLKYNLLSFLHRDFLGGGPHDRYRNGWSVFWTDIRPDPWYGSGRALMGNISLLAGGV
jgi:hypothetical protein